MTENYEKLHLSDTYSWILLDTEGRSVSETCFQGMDGKYSSLFLGGMESISHFFGRDGKYSSLFWEGWKVFVTFLGGLKSGQQIKKYKQMKHKI